MDTLLDVLGIFGLLALTVLLVAYAYERWFGTTWPWLHQPLTLRQLVCDWLLYMLLFAGLGTVLERALRFACSISC
ncbi:MAG: hypothetical protein GDA66_13590 [Nitrospira sp. CR1.2]|nr:hypothetical protein [Nitrospira sp. CR1.2]